MILATWPCAALNASKPVKASQERPQHRSTIAQGNRLLQTAGRFTPNGHLDHFWCCRGRRASPHESGERSRQQSASRGGADLLRPGGESHRDRASSSGQSRGRQFPTPLRLRAPSKKVQYPNRRRSRKRFRSGKGPHGGFNTTSAGDKPHAHCSAILYPGAERRIVERQVRAVFG